MAYDRFYRYYCAYSHAARPSTPAAIGAMPPSTFPTAAAPVLALVLASSVVVALEVCVSPDDVGASVTIDAPSVTDAAL